MKKFNDNASNRKTYVGDIFSKGEFMAKEEILNTLDRKWKFLHNNAWIHIHDLDAYGSTYNCLTIDFISKFKYEEFENISETHKIIKYFEYLKLLFEKLGNEQSGGMAIANFDIDTSTIFNNINVNILKNKDLIYECIFQFIEWNTLNNTRMGKQSYYITLNIGLGIDENSREISKILLNAYKNSGQKNFRPNIVFKIKNGINFKPTDINYDLLLKSIEVSNSKMIPTYLFCDSSLDRNIDPKKLSIVGCRSRIAENIFSTNKTAVGRGNIANISINLVKISLWLLNNNKLNINNFLKVLDYIMNITKDILIHRYNKTCLISDDQKYTFKELWFDSRLSFSQLFKHGTLSIGFIGLSEAVELLTNSKYWKNKESYKIALTIIRFFRKNCDIYTKENNLNFSVIAPSGELISSRFLDIDKREFYNEKYSDFFSKNYYTNSFHIDVDSGISAREKIYLEGKFHKYCNGGSITYVELKEAPQVNIEGIYELIEIAYKSDIRYLGFNFPLDICGDCDYMSIFNNNCDKCNSSNIKRIRRVSGYLEIQDFFTKGKYYESKKRKSN